MFRNYCLPLQQLIEHHFSEQECDIPLYYWRGIGDFCFICVYMNA